MTSSADINDSTVQNCTRSSTSGVADAERERVVIVPELVRVGVFGSHTAVLGRFGFRLGEVVGEGSYCRVRAASDFAHPERRLAAKIINRTRASADFVARFLPRELEVLAWIRHPNIVRIYRIIDFRDYVYIFMDLADTDLLERIKEHGPLPEELCQRYFRQLLLAINYLHLNDVTHRDLKCENVLIFPDNVVKLTDFGFARMCHDRTSGTRILSSTYCGSAAYAAPEILSGQPYNPKLYDVWSMGVILFTMLTATLPFDDRNHRRMLALQKAKRFVFPIHIEENISGTCKQIIRWILEPNLLKRALVSQLLNHLWLRWMLEPDLTMRALLPQLLKHQWMNRNA